MAKVCVFDEMLVNNVDYEYLAFPITKEIDLYKDDFDSESEPEQKGDPTLHGFEMAKYAFEHNHADAF